MRVLQVIPAVAPRYGGPSEAVVALTRGLLRQGVEVEVVTTDADGLERLSVPLGSLTTWRSIPVRFFPRQFSESYKYSRPLARWLSKSVRGFDLVHVHAIFSHASVAAARACRRHDVPYVIRPLGSLDPVTLSRNPIRKRIFHSVCGRAMLEYSSAVQYSTEREMNLVERRFMTGRGFVAPPGIGPCSVCMPEAGISAENRGTDPDAPYVLFLGRLDPIKGLERLIEGFSTVTRDTDLGHWSLVIAGDGDPAYVAGLRARAAEATTGGRIRFRGWLTGAERAAAFSGAALFALPSSHENFGRAAAEAMLAGVPVVVSDEVFIADEIRRHDAGWVVSCEVDAIVDALREAMRSGSARRLRARAGRALATSRFDNGASTGLIVDRYRSILAARDGVGAP